MSSQRQLAVIMFTDIVGYTALMGKDEERALAILRTSRSIHKTAIDNAQGKWLKEMGDGILAQFGSAVNAVQCALEIQKNAQDLGGKIRIGLHLGDVSIEHEDVFGDGVNIASRIQSIADPGAIYITDSIYSAVRSQASIQTQYLGELALKNVDHGVKVYSLVASFLPKPDASRIKQLLFAKKSEKKKLIVTVLLLAVISIAVGIWWFNLTKVNEISSLVVLPVKNLTGNPAYEFYSEGVHEALNSSLGQLTSLRVPSVRTSLKYRDSNQSSSEIARELGVNAVVEPTLNQIDDSIKLRIALIRVKPQEEQIWSNEFVKDMPSILSLYNDITMEISKVLNIQLTEDQKLSFAQVKKIDPRATEAYMRGLSYWYKLTAADLDQALRYFELAMEIEPEYAPAYTGVAMVWGGKMQQGLMPGNLYGHKLDSLLKIAVTLDSNSAEVHFCIAIFNTWWNWNWARAEAAYKKAIELSPENHAAVRAYYSHYLHIVGRPKEAIEQIEKAIEIDPINPLFQALYGMDLNYARKFDQAIALLNNTLVNAPRDPTTLSTLRSAYHNRGLFDQAYETYVLSYQAKDDHEAVAALQEGFRDGRYEGALSKLAELLIQRSADTYIPAWQIATLYTRANNPDLAVHYLNVAFEEHDANMPYINIDPIFDNLKSNPSFREIVLEMKFPK